MYIIYEFNIFLCQFFISLLIRPESDLIHCSLNHLVHNQIHEWKDEKLWIRFKKVRPHARKLQVAWYLLPTGHGGAPPFWHEPEAEEPLSARWITWSPCALEENASGRTVRVSVGREVVPCPLGWRSVVTATTTDRRTFGRVTNFVLNCVQRESRRDASRITSRLHTRYNTFSERKKKTIRRKWTDA